MEQLDHRQLLAVNFTGNVPIDFPATQSPGVVVIPSPPDNQTPIIPGPIQGIVSASGFQVNQLRVSYTADDILNIGIEGPLNGRDGRQVIAGDADNNGNSATVDPRLSNAQGTGVSQGFQDPADFGGTETYGIQLYLNQPNNRNSPDISAGFPLVSLDPNGSKPFTVARAANPANNGGDRFDLTSQFPQYTGNFFSANDPNRPNVELQITNFSQLYQMITGQALTPQTILGIGAFGSSSQSGGISDEFFPPQAVTLGAATPTPTPTPVIGLAKFTNGFTAPSAPGPIVTVGSPITFTYNVTNPGNEPLRNVVLVDDAGTPGVPADDFMPTLLGGDADGDAQLDPGETFLYSAPSVARAGQYENRAVTTGVGVTSGTPVTATALSHYFATTPTPPPFCPPVSPTVFVNFHEKNHINTAHPTAIRVNVLGSSGFDPTNVNLGTVRLGAVGMSAATGSAPILAFERNVNRDEFPDETFVFNGLGLNIPAGDTRAEISGQLNDGTIFVSSVRVFNRDYSFYSQGEINQQQAAFARYDLENNIPITGGFVAPPPRIPAAARQRAASMAIDDLYNPLTGRVTTNQATATATAAGARRAASAEGPVVSIPTKNGKGVKAAKAKAVKVDTAVARKGPSIHHMIAGGA